MSFFNQGLDAKLKSATVSTVVSDQNPLIQLANLIDWKEMAAIVFPDLQRTTAKGLWFLGRRLYLRVHLAVMILLVYSNLPIVSVSGKFWPLRFFKYSVARA